MVLQSNRRGRDCTIMTWTGPSWRLSRVQLACKTGFIATVFFCIIEFLLVQRVAYDGEHDVPIEGILKKKVNVGDYGSAFSVNPPEGEAVNEKENAARRKLSSEQSFSRGKGKGFPPNLPARNELQRKSDKIHKDIKLMEYGEGSEDMGIRFDIPDGLADDLIHQPPERSESKRFEERGSEDAVPRQIFKSGLQTMKGRRYHDNNKGEVQFR